jgi:hypothetical protein
MSSTADRTNEAVTGAGQTWPGAIAVNCPGCGCRTSIAAVWSSVDRCPRCGTPLMMSSRSLDVERVVRERLYGPTRTNALGEIRSSSRAKR